MSDRPSRDETWLRVAETIAQRGTCPRRQVGCVIVDIHGRVMATGYNGPASGRPHCSEGEPCPGAHFQSGEGLDKCEAIHAEQNACLLLDDPWKVDTIYITASPCLSCVKLLLGTSAKRIVCRELYPHSDAVDWWHRAGRELIVLPKDQTLKIEWRCINCKWVVENLVEPNCCSKCGQTHFAKIASI